MISPTQFKDSKSYEIEITAIKQELKTLPPGYLVKRETRYYAKAGPVEKGITKEPQKVMQLARKAYLLQKLKHMEWNFSLAQKQSKPYKTEDLMEIVQELSAAYQGLPAKYFFHPSVHDQFEKTTTRNVSHPESLIYLTDSGIYVRSKSERTIANALDQKGIPYHYEAALAVGGASKYPDFTIFRPSDGKMFLWEHLGLMDDGGYRQKTIEKIALYAQYGFFTYDNLICTYEQDLHDPAHIHGLIEVFLLR